MNIVLIGMRGSGKTTVGELLAKKLNRDFIETDLLVEKTVEMSIRQIVERYGWQKFRNYEAKVVEEISGSDKVVIATGGGVVENEQNINHFKKNNDVIIWLKCSINTIISRIGNDASRPFITNADNFIDDLRNVNKKRESLYVKYGDLIISSEENAETAVNNIIAKLKERNLI